MNTRRVILGAILFVLFSFNILWGARIIQDQEPVDTTQEEKIKTQEMIEETPPQPGMMIEQEKTFEQKPQQTNTIRQPKPVEPKPLKPRVLNQPKAVDAKVQQQKAIEQQMKMNGRTQQPGVVGQGNVPPVPTPPPGLIDEEKAGEVKPQQGNAPEQHKVISTNPEQPAEGKATRQKAVQARPERKIPAPVDPNGQSNGTEQPQVVTKDGKQYITMDFDGVDIKVFIKFIADLTGENYIMDDKVSGKVTVISPRKMTIDEAYKVFLSVLEVNGYTTVKVGSVTKVMKSADAMTKSIETITETTQNKEDRMVTQIIPLQYVDANDMKNLLSPLTSKGTSQMLAYPQSNLLIITDTLPNIKKIMDILKVVDVTGFAPEVKIIPLLYASAADLSAKLSEILSEDKVEEVKRMRNLRQPGGAVTGKSTTKIIPYDRTNSLILLASSSEITGLEELIKKLDIPTPTGKEDIHVYYLQYASAEDLAKVLTNVPTPENPEAPTQSVPGAPNKPPIQRSPSSSSIRTQQQEIKIMPDKETNSLIIYADPYAYRSIVETIKYLDIPRKQVYVKALIMEVNTTKDFKVGVEWTYFEDFKYDNDKRTGGVMGRTGQSFMTTPADLPSGALLGVVGEAITINQNGTQITFPNITSFINAMAGDSDVNIISTPQIITMDNKKAEIKVGANVPYLTKENTDSTNLNNTVRTFDYRDIGVTLRITPQINQQGGIRLEIFEETSNLVPGTGDKEYAPTTLKRSATTTVTVKDGYTMVIGGLILDNLTLGNSRVPLLGDIPILGYLFKSVTRNREQTNLYIFLTPYIIDSDDKINNLYKEKYGEMKGIMGKDVKSTMEKEVKEKELNEKEVKDQTEDKKGSGNNKEEIKATEDKKATEVKTQPEEKKTTEEKKEDIKAKEETKPDTNINNPEEKKSPEDTKGTELKKETENSKASEVSNDTEVKKEPEIAKVPEEKKGTENEVPAP